MEVNNPDVFISKYHKILHQIQLMCLLATAARIVILASYTI